MDTLPDHLLDLICANCNAKTLAILECVSTQMRDASKRAPLHVHFTPANARSLDTWADDPSRKGRVVKVSSRRVSLAHLEMDFPRVQVIDAMYARIQAWLPAPGGYPHLKRLRLNRVSRHLGQADVFRTSWLPATLEDVTLVFDTSWRRVDMDATHPHLRTLSIKCIDGHGFRQPDILVGAAGTGTVTDLTLSTCGALVVTDPKDSGCLTRAVFECEDNSDAGPVLKLVGPATETLVLSMPLASVAMTRELAGLDPRILAVEAAFVAIDALPGRLEYLELRVERLATIRVPPHITICASVRAVDLDRSFFD